MEIPSFDSDFLKQTNNYHTNTYDGLRNRWQKWRNRPNFNRGYDRIPESDLEYINTRNHSTWEETSFHQSEPDTRIQIDPYDEEVNLAEESFDEVIDIPEAVGETTGLLSGTTAVGTAAVGSIGGTAGGIGSTLGTAGVGATAVLGGTALALGSKALYDRVSEKGFVLPNSEFIGPCNPINIGAAKNPSEQAAKDHDCNYASLIAYAKNNYISQEDFSNYVHHLDQKAIDEFEKDWKETGNWHAFVGKYGLKLKQVAEKVYGEDRKSVV